MRHNHSFHGCFGMIRNELFYLPLGFLPSRPPPTRWYHRIGSRHRLRVEHDALIGKVFRAKPSGVFKVWTKLPSENVVLKKPPIMQWNDENRISYRFTYRCCETAIPNNSFPPLLCDPSSREQIGQGTVRRGFHDQRANSV